MSGKFLVPKNITDLSEWRSEASTESMFPGEAREGHAHKEGHSLVYVLVPLGALAFIAILSFVVVYILRKSKLDKLRHHLMPMYNFDPAEEEGDWESELLEEDKEQQIALHIKSPSPPYGPKLKFSHDLRMDL